MSEPRIYVDMALADQATVTLGEAAYRHLVVVLRRIRGDSITLFNGRGGEYSGTIESVARKKLDVRLWKFNDVSRESKLDVTLAQAVSKGDHMDTSIQKAVELGVTAIQPVITDHVVVRLDAERWARKQEHWQGVAVSAAEQSGRTTVPTVAPVLDLRDWIQAVPADAIRLVLSPTASTSPLKHQAGQPVMLLVGPEGGLSDLELKLADMTGFTALPLGPRILRTETAGMVALSVLQSKWGDITC